MCEKVAIYSFKVQWTPGKTHLIADALSRAPLFTAQDLPGLEIDTAITCLSATSSSSLEVVYSSIDEDYRLLLSQSRMALIFLSIHPILNRILTHYPCQTA